MVRNDAALMTMRQFALQPVKHAEQAVEAEQRQCRSAPDHQSALPAEGAGNFPLAAPGNEKRFVVLAFHQDDRRARIEIVRLPRHGGAGVGRIRYRSR